MSLSAGITAVLIDFAKWAIDTGRAELAKEILAYWRSRNFGPVPRDLKRWAEYDAATDAELRRRKEADDDGA